MCSCSALKKVIGGGVLAKDVVEGKPWVCLSLKCLSICFMFSDKEQHLQPLIFERLAKLTRLEHLCSGAVGRSFQKKYPVPLQLRLQSGLNILSGLWRMVSFTASQKLVLVYANLDIDEVTRAEFKNLFKSHGIELWR
ncbi:hypothetical protein EDD21DRAFT_349883 [Dissophora ornata]|nr:hypothetical protein EDD21DRAFT_349883 [Dissophora ornata]